MKEEESFASRADAKLCQMSERASDRLVTSRRELWLQFKVSEPPSIAEREVEACPKFSYQDRIQIVDNRMMRLFEKRKDSISAAIIDSMSASLRLIAHQLTGL